MAQRRHVNDDIHNVNNIQVVNQVNVIVANGDDASSQDSGDIPDQQDGDQSVVVDPQADIQEQWKFLQKRERENWLQERNKPRSKLKQPKNQFRPQPALTQGKDLSEVYDSGRVLNEKELQITGVPKGMQYFKLASKGRRNIRRLNKKLASQTEAADIVTMPYIIAKWDRELMDRERDLLKVHPSITYNSSQSKSSTDLFILLKETTKTRSRNPLPISPKKNNTLKA